VPPAGGVRVVSVLAGVGVVLACVMLAWCWCHLPFPISVVRYTRGVVPLTSHSGAGSKEYQISAKDKEKKTHTERRYRCLSGAVYAVPVVCGPLGRGVRRTDRQQQHTVTAPRRPLALLN
jgi:hypothetical protein